MAAEPTTPSPRIPILPGRIRHLLVGSAVSFARSVPGAAGVLALSGSVAVSLWVVLAAAQRRSFLSPPARRDFAPWLVGPLGHRLPELTREHGHAAHRADRRARSAGALLARARGRSRRACGSSGSSRRSCSCTSLYALGPPLSLTDLFNYLHYGRLGALYGHNPYADLPLLAPGDPAYRFSNWHHLPSPYGPFFTLIGYALAPLPLHAAYWTWKAIAALASLGLPGARLVARASGSAARRSAPSSSPG